MKYATQRVEYTIDLTNANKYFKRSRFTREIYERDLILQATVNFFQRHALDHEDLGCLVTEVYFYLETTKLNVFSLVFSITGVQ